ncbi:P-II family nitrogen regulator [Ornithinibacillus sp. 4-3]|uniref:P-II family nitrogen regulator n=1 Tax=Ornithinibacillus sp. 4-3 TaxID=3231488 RepID=A0AB39HP51_9BACI
MFSSSDANDKEYERICIIVNYGLGSKIIQKARSCGVSGGTVLLGKGTVKSRLLEFLAIDEVRKEVVFMVADKETARKAIGELDKKFKFSKPNHGIAFTTSVGYIIGAGTYKKDDYLKEDRGAEQIMYHVISVIVEKGNAEYVIDAAVGAGSKGGTILNARGSGIHETSKLFAMEIEPEKEMVLILSEKETTEAIARAIKKKLKIDEPGNGIIFIQDVHATYGLYK